ncbi:44319_t:CDS:2, partial [Gigaspora margarita]
DIKEQKLEDMNRVDNIIVKNISSKNILKNSELFPRSFLRSLQENKSDDKSNNDFDVSIDITNESECFKITKYLKNFKNILVQLFILAIASVIVFLVSNVMESLVEDLPLSEKFLSIIVLGFIGSVPEHATSINSFYKNDSDSGLNNAFGSNLMMLDGVLPIFTILGWIMNISFSVVTFSPIFILIFITYILVHCAISDGITHSMEGIVLFALYILIARILF